ncbi:hypothetical protein O3Q51_06580 [Cryomorphaceae bacterium 1068]|nr:hypothetical protein [Cryomorphaceae bacterium 1068]
MKKHLLIISTLAFAAGLTAFGFIKDNELNQKVVESPCEPIEESVKSVSKASCQAVFSSTNSITEITKPKTLTDFFYDFGTRFNPITKEDLSKARNVSDFIDRKEIKLYDGVGSTTLIIIEDDVQTEDRFYGEGEKLSKEQLKIMKSMDYSSHFLLRAELKTDDKEMIAREENIYRPHMTIVPKIQASYEGGKDGLLSYIRQENEKNIYNLDEKKLQLAKLSFTVTKDGIVEDALLDRTSGYSRIDEAIISLVSNLPGKWEPAENANGEKIDQVLVLSFGMVGC